MSGVQAQVGRRSRVLKKVINAGCFLCWLWLRRRPLLSEIGIAIFSVSSHRVGCGLHARLWAKRGGIAYEHKIGVKSTGGLAMLQPCAEHVGGRVDAAAEGIDRSAEDDAITLAEALERDRKRRSLRVGHVLEKHAASEEAAIGDDETALGAHAERHR